jgi:hypothetical protein
MALTRRQLNLSALSVAQKAVINRAITGGTELGAGLDEAQCAYLAVRIALDLVHNIAGIPSDIAPFFGTNDLAILRLEGVDFLPLFETLCAQVPDAETYFDCLAALHKRRLKYQRILEYQPIPNLNQVGPRGLLRYGTLGSTALAGWLFWRKWLFDIDNRAGQETGYIFEPIVARCVGGEPFPASKSPVKRRDGSGKGRQVDCVYGDRAYEIKLRVTIAASGQGRWGEEKDFPADCQASGFIPVLLVFDDTQADKLDELSAVFRAHGGEVRIGAEAWQHLEELAGPTMSIFLEQYVRSPLKDLLNNAPARDSLPDLSLKMSDKFLEITIGSEVLTIARPSLAGSEPQASEDTLADDV